MHASVRPAGGGTPMIGLAGFGLTVILVLKGRAVKYGNGVGEGMAETSGERAGRSHKQDCVRPTYRGVLGGREDGTSVRCSPRWAVVVMEVG